MEELINELDIFVNEKAVLSAQIRDIENKRNELAKERNTKKAQNKIKNAGIATINDNHALSILHHNSTTKIIVATNQTNPPDKRVIKSLLVFLLL